MVWVVLTTGKRMPLDPEPRDDGTVLLGRSDNLAEVIAPTAPTPAGRQRYAPHFATCPNAGQHRRRRS